MRLRRFGFLAQDILVVKDAEHREWMWSTSISELDGRYLFLTVSRDTARVRIFLSFSPHHPPGYLHRKTYSGWRIYKKMKSIKTSSGRS